MSFEHMLDEYLSLKEHKAMLDQQNFMLMQEKNRIEMLLQGMQNAMNVYNALQKPNVSAIKNQSTVVPQLRLCRESNTNLGVSIINTNNVQTGNFSAPMISVPDKRKDIQTVNGPTVAKKPRGRPPSRKIPVQGQNTLLPPIYNAVNNQVVSQSSYATQSWNGHYSAPTGSHVATCNGEASTSSCYNGQNTRLPPSNGINNQILSQPSFATQPLDCNAPNYSLDRPQFPAPIPTNSPISMTPPTTHSSHTDTHVSHPKVSEVATTSYIADMHKSLEKSLTKEVSISESDLEISDIYDFESEDWEKMS